MNARELFPWYGEHTKGVVLPQIVFDCEREPGQILHSAHVIRMDPRVVECLLVVGHVLVGVRQGRLETPHLE